MTTHVPPIIPRPRVLEPDGAPGQLVADRLLVWAEDPQVRSAIDGADQLARRMLGLGVADAARADAQVLIEVVDVMPVTADKVPAVRGIDPRVGGTVSGADETYLIEPVGASGPLRVQVTGAEGAFRALTTLLQTLGTSGERGVWTLPSLTIADGPDYAWRGLSLDVVRHFFPVAEVERVIDLLALNKFSVLHLHLSDSQAWRVEMTSRPELTAPGPDGEREFFTQAEFTHLIGYAAARFVTVVPEFDMPGHTAAAIAVYPELQPPEAKHPLMQYLDPRTPAALDFARDVITELAGLSPGPYLHVGGDEAFGMPHDLYAQFMRATIGFARDAGKIPFGWQETVRSGDMGPGDALQFWISASEAFDADALKATAPVEYHPLVDLAAETFALAPGDMALAAQARVPVILSPSGSVYLDRKYAEPSHDQAQTRKLETLGFPNYTPQPTRSLLDWSAQNQPEPHEVGIEPAGVEAAMWCETVTGFDDLALLLLPRLAILAERFWGTTSEGPQDLPERLAAHPPLWEALGFHAYYRSTDVFPAGAPTTP